MKFFHKTLLLITTKKFIFKSKTFPDVSHVRQRKQSCSCGKEEGERENDLKIDFSLHNRDVIEPSSHTTSSFCWILFSLSLTPSSSSSYPNQTFYIFYMSYKSFLFRLNSFFCSSLISFWIIDEKILWWMSLKIC